jgi:cytochrome P450
MRSDPLGLFTDVQREYGHYVRLRIVPSFYCHLLTHPDAVEHILQKAHRNYRKPDMFYNSVGLLVGNGLFTNEGDDWLRQRKLASPAFHRQYISLLCPRMVEGAEAFIREHEDGNGEPIDILDGMMKLGLRVAGTTLFSADISGHADVIGKTFRKTFAHVSRRLNSMQIVPNWLPTPANLSFARAKRMLDRMVMELIAARRRNPDKPNDLLTMLVGAHDEETGRGMVDRQLMDEVMTLLTAGHENVGAALAWTWYLMAAHPEIQEQLHDEIHARLRGANPTMDDLEHMPLLTAAFEESLRLYPPGWGELRENIAADEIAGFAIPAKATIVLCQWVTHRHPDFWDEPLRFKPERFLPSAAERNRFAYFPFGGGPRICIGMQFALIEGPLILATILQQFRVELVAGQRIEPDATFTLRPKYGVKVILHPRRRVTSGA